MIENNSANMKTVVETYLIEETVDLIYDNEKLEKWNSIVEELGLSGQTQIVKPEKSPIPFMHMKQSFENIFQTLCPAKRKINQYDLTPIPLEILELVALSTREQYFNDIEVWYDDKAPDPVAVGIVYTNWYVEAHGKAEKSGFPTKKEAEEYANTIGGGKVSFYSWYNKKYLIGRWGDVKHSFEELKEMATKRYITQNEVTIKQQIKDAERQLVDLETTAFNMFN